MATVFLNAPVPGRYNVWIPQAQLGNITARNPGTAFTNGAYAAFGTLQEAVADARKANMGVVLEPTGAYSPTQAWSGASSFQASLPAAAMVNLNPPVSSTPMIIPASPVIVTVPPAPAAPPAAAVIPADMTYNTLGGLPMATGPLTGRKDKGELENVNISPLADGSGIKIAFQTRSKKPNEAPILLKLTATQTAMGTVALKEFNNVFQLVVPNAAVAEAEVELKFADFAVQGLKSGSMIGIYIKWPTGHDRGAGEAPIYTLAIP